MDHSSRPAGRRIRFLRWLPAAAWMGSVLVASGEAMSHGQTSRFFHPLMQWLVPGISEAKIEQVHFIIRKCGHLAEYALLAGLLWFAVGSWKTGWGKALLVLVLAVLCAGLDEWRQSWTATRGASVADVGIDAVGAALGIGVILLAIRLFRKEA